MITPASLRHRIFWNVTIVISIIIAIYSTIFCLTRGIYEVFPFLYFLPIILFVNFYPNRGVVFSLAISSVFLLLVYFFTNFNPALIAVSTAWFVIFVTIGFVTSSFAEGFREEERKYREIFENSQAGIFTFSLPTLQILEMNRKCAQMLGYNRYDLIGKELGLIFQDPVERDAFVVRIQKNAEIADIELLLHTQEGQVRQFLVSASLSPGNRVICSAVDITERTLAERVIRKAREDLERKVKERSEELMRTNDALKAEILERKRFEATLQLANRKLNTLSSVTHHDILNQITAIVLSISRAEEMVTDPALLEHLKKIEQSTQVIQQQIRFARDYQDIGLYAPQWQNVDTTIRNAIAGLDPGAVKIELALNNLEILADVLLDRVFSAIVDNALRHGQRVTQIRFFAQETGEGLTIFCLDDGAGIPAGEKEGIFRQGYHRNTGYGLFLASEILGITEIPIFETGEPGSGARFEIRVPKGAYRFT
ncbi:MAG: PAS domain-containing sensor histidine kinase [Methanoregula sp.]|nr:PAS domain-containing sensor histidine kinase [Methanoregula sp.]